MRNIIILVLIIVALAIVRSLISDVSRAVSKAMKGSDKTKGEAKQDHGGHECQTKHDERQIVQSSVPGGGGGTNSWVSGESQACKSESGEGQSQGRETGYS